MSKSCQQTIDEGMAIRYQKQEIDSLKETIRTQKATIDRLTSQRDRWLELLKYSNQALKDGIEDDHELEAEHSKHARLLCANNDALIAEIEATPAASQSQSQTPGNISADS